MDDPLEARYRVGDGVWSDQVPVEPQPVSPFSQLVIDGLAQVCAAMTEFINALIPQIAGALETVGRILRPGFPYRVGDPVPEICRIVKPAKGGKTWFAWYGDYWRPIHRERGRGWVWTE